MRSLRLGKKVQRLIYLADQLQSDNSASLLDKCNQLLDIHSNTEDFIPNSSCLNNDGTPLQLCLTSSSNGVVLRLIADPGAYYSDSEQRYNSSIRTLLKTIHDSGSSELKETAETSIKLLLPQNVNDRSIYKQGFVWIGVSPQQNGIAFYLEMAPLDQQKGWYKVENWLKAILPYSQEAITVIHKLKNHCIVASAGLEGSKIENTRAKIYFRLKNSSSLDDLNLDIFSSKEVKDFFSIATAQYNVDQQGMVMSIGFNLLTGEHVDAKIDLCGHCLRYSSTEWISIIDRISKQYAITTPEMEFILHSQEYQIAFIGLGLTLDKKPRINIYINHNFQTSSPESEEIWAALKDSMRYLISVQNTNGSWHDYHLPVGTSDQWVTAYAAHALAQYGKISGNIDALNAANHAANWLILNRSYQAGWGFNARTGPDSDSTAMVVALLDELGIIVDDKDRIFLKDRWKENQGISTYTQPNAWADGHWDVTPWGYHGLLAEDKVKLKVPFQKALRENQMNNGFWRSYWWRNPYYSTFITLEILEKLNIEEPDTYKNYDSSHLQIDNAFDLACYIGIECIKGYPNQMIGNHIRALLNWQSDIGQWYGSPNLRVTDNFCYQPWDSPSGTYYDDKKSTITNATVMRVLSRIITSKNSPNSEIIYNWI